MASSYLKNNLPKLSLIANSPLNTQKAIINSCEADLICSIIEICLNLVAGNINKLTLSERKKLKKFRKQIIRLARVHCIEKNCVKEKKIINQKATKNSSLLSTLLTPSILNFISTLPTSSSSSTTSS